MLFLVSFVQYAFFLVLVLTADIILVILGFAMREQVLLINAGKSPAEH